MPDKLQQDHQQPRANAAEGQAVEPKAWTQPTLVPVGKVNKLVQTIPSSTN